MLLRRGRLAMVGFLTVPLVLLVLWLSDGIGMKRFFWMAIQAVGFSGPLVWYHRRSANQTNMTNVHVLLLLMWAWSALASFFAATVGVSPAFRGALLDIGLSFLWMSVFWPVSALITSYEMFRFAIRAVEVVGIVISSSVYGGFFLYRFFGIRFGEIITVEESNFFRCFGPLGDQVGFIIVLFVLLSLVRGRYKEAAFHIGAIVMTSTRGAMISVFVGYVWLIANDSNHKSRLRRYGQAVTMLLIIILATVAYGLTSAGQTSTARVLDSSLLAHGAGSRMLTYRLAVSIILANPVFGTGWGGFRDHWMNYADAATLGMEDDLERWAFTTQNQLLQFGTNSGVPGVVLYIMFVVALLRESRRVVKSGLIKDQGLLRGLDAYLAGIFIGNQGAIWFNMYSSSGFFIMVAAAALVSYGAIPRCSRLAHDVSPRNVVGTRAASGTAN